MPSEPSAPIVSGIFALTVAESKRLIAKAVVRLPEVVRAYASGRIVVANGTTNAFVAAELLGKDLPWFNYAAGVICDGLLAETNREDRILPYVFDKGEVVQMGIRDAVLGFGRHDVFIKGANAVDPQGNVGIAMADEGGGTIGSSLSAITARGAYLVCPVGLEKLVPNVPDAARKCGIYRFQYALGSPVGLMPVTNAKVVTEIEALRLLTGVAATHVASGGVGGSEGAVVLVAEGSEAQVATTIKLLREIKEQTKNVEKAGPITWRPVQT